MRAGKKGWGGERKSNREESLRDSKMSPFLSAGEEFLYPAL